MRRDGNVMALRDGRHTPDLVQAVQRQAGTDHIHAAQVQQILELGRVVKMAAQAERHRGLVNDAREGVAREHGRRLVKPDRVLTFHGARDDGRIARQ